MKPTSYQIVHWQLNELPVKTPPAAATYIVLWWREIPLAHVWWQPGKSQEFLKSLKKSLQPGIEFYTGTTSIPETFEEMAAALARQNILPSSREKKSVSVVICTRNRPEALQRCLESLQEQDSTGFEIIVVDNAPDSDATKTIVQGIPGVRYILEPRKGLDVARNTGGRYAQNNIIAYTDDDVVLPGNWVSRIATAFEDPLTMAVTGLTMPISLASEAEIIFEQEWGFNKGFVPRVFDHKYFLAHQSEGAPVWDIGAGANMAFRKEAFLLAGWFDERLDVGAAGCSGDSEMWFRILAEGWNCVYLPYIYAFHQHRSTIDGLTNQLYHYMKGHACSLLIQHEKYPGTGNEKRARQRMPAFYRRRIVRKLLSISKQSDPFLSTEIAGFRAGLEYYRTNTQASQTGIRCLPLHLLQPATNPKNGLVSIIIPSYNHAKFLTLALGSVLNQTYKYWEIIVVDDGSTDNTAMVCEQFKGRLIYKAVHRVGLGAARNIGAMHASGDYLVFLDADDLLYEKALEMNLFFFSYYPDAVMVSGAHKIIDEAGRETSPQIGQVKVGKNYEGLLYGNYIAMEGTAMYRSGLFPHYHFNTQLQACEDYDLNLAIARDLPVYGHDQLIAAYRHHAQNMSANKVKMLTNALLVLEKQRQLLWNDEQKQAFAEGIINWQNTYK